ncbi:MAG TPA: mycofactocin system GMC family oxidoreductase MftG, partial [Dehalococcoidia bacterium]|nr:mycofactocin system GMC family oxidoreductase MftG [Dehalococcoidia bacterium]
PNGIRFSTALGYLNPARHRLNLTIKPNCVTRKIIFDGKRAVGVEVESGGERFTVEAEEIILSSGAIGSPHIMLLSGVGPAAHLQEMGIPVVHDLPGIGQNLRDHPMVYTTWKTKPDYPLDGFAARVQTILRWTAQGSDVRNDLLIFMQSYATDRNYRGVGDVPPLGIRMLGSLELQLSAGELKLTSTDPDEQPSLEYRYFEHEEDLRRMREAVRLCVSLGEHDSFKDIIETRIEPTEEELSSDDALDAYMKREATTGQHISGTCKMGPFSDKMAVVDQFGKVHGMENLRIVDASIMPDCIRANTNVTTMMIGEKVSEFIREGK